MTFDGMLCLVFPWLRRWTIIAVQEPDEQIIYYFNAVHFFRRRSAERWVSEATPLFAAQYKIVRTKEVDL